MLGNGTDEERSVQPGRFIAIEPPCRSEGIRLALQVAFRDGFDLPADMRACLEKLDRIQR